MAASTRKVTGNVSGLQIVSRGFHFSSKHPSNSQEFSKESIKNPNKTIEESFEFKDLNCGTGHCGGGGEWLLVNWKSQLKSFWSLSHVYWPQGEFLLLALIHSQFAQQNAKIPSITFPLQTFFLTVIKHLHAPNQRLQKSNFWTSKDDSRSTVTLVTV